MDLKYLCKEQNAENDAFQRRCCEDELIMNNKENEILLQNNESMLAHQLFTNMSLEDIPELESDLEQTEIERLKEENKKVL